MCADAGCPGHVTERVCSPSSLSAHHCFINNLIIIYYPLHFWSEMIKNILMLCSFWFTNLGSPGIIILVYIDNSVIL